MAKTVPSVLNVALHMWALVLNVALHGATTCLTDGILESQRRNLTLGEASTPLQMVAHAWDSSELITEIFKVLVEEVLGVNTHRSVISSSGQTMYALAGCNMDGSSCHGRPQAQYHIDMENWDAYALVQTTDLQENYPDRFPNDLGSTGYDGEDVLIISNARIHKKAWSLAELPLELYRSFDTSGFKSMNIFTNHMDIPSQTLAPCSQTQLVDQGEILNYLKWTHDIDGVEFDSSGKGIAKCYNDFWWVSPACRDMPDRCVPLITGGNGWGLNTWMQKAAVYNMPLILATASNGSMYRSLPLQYDVLVHWWVPDAAFVSNDPVQIWFPKHNADEWKVGNKATAGERQRISKKASVSLNRDAPLAYRLASAVSLSIQTMDALLLQLSNNGGLVDSTACAWLLSNRQFVEQWIPNPSECVVGQGIIDDVGEFTRNNNNSVGCDGCAPGTYSVVLKELGIRACEPCAPGYFNNAIGADVCQPCPAGKFTDLVGKAECDRCSIGRFRNASGNNSVCQACPPTTTTRAVGAERVEDCACEDGTYESDLGTCKPCPIGVSCRNGDLPLLKPSFMMLPNASRTSIPLEIFMCGSEVRCPGQVRIESPVCAEHMHGLNCALCEEGFYMQGTSKCKSCADGSYASVLLASLMVFLFCGFFLWSWNRHTEEVEAGEAMRNRGPKLASVIFGITLAYLQTLGIFSTLHVRWPTLIHEIVSAIHRVLFDFKDYLAWPCGFKRSFQVTYVVNLIMPIALLGFYAAWFCVYRLLEYATERIYKFSGFSWIRTRSYDLNEIANSFGMMVQAIYLPFVLMTVSMVECFAPNAKMRVLRRYPAVECWSGEHSAMIPAIVLGFLAYIVGTLSLVSYLLRAAISRYADKGFRVRIRFLVFKFRPPRWWYGLSLLFRSILLGLVNVVAPTSGQLQFLIVSSVLIASLVAHVALKPYMDFYANTVEAVELGILIAMMGIGSCFIEDPDIRSPESIEILAMILVIMLVVCILTLVLGMTYALYVAWHPELGERMRHRIQTRLIPRVRNAVDTIQKCPEELLMNLLLNANYIDRGQLSQVASWLLLELQGTQPDSSFDLRLCSFTNFRKCSDANHQRPNECASEMPSGSSTCANAIVRQGSGECLSERCSVSSRATASVPQGSASDCASEKASESSRHLPSLLSAQSAADSHAKATSSGNKKNARLGPRVVPTEVLE